MRNERSSETPIASTFPKFLTDKGKGQRGDDGNYRRDAERELDRFLRWCRGDAADPANAEPPAEWDGLRPPSERDRDVTFADLDATAFGDYARYLRASGLSNGTVRTYYAHVASWCGWAHGQGYVPRHYARESDAEDPLPNDDGRRPGDQQAWTPDHRDRITRFVDERAEAAIDRFADLDVPPCERDDPESTARREKESARFEAVKRCRERALAYVLAYTGLRAAEFLNDPDDDRAGRNGLRWADVSFADKNATVFRKKQAWDEASLPDPLLGPLRRYRRLLDPPSEWPVFPTLHRPTLARHVTSELAENGHDEGEIVRIREGTSDLLVAAEHDLSPPPALKPNGARRVMKRLCDDAGIDLDGDRHGYLAPHGGRRGMGEVFVREFGYAAAARYLDNSEEQVRDAYQHIEAAEQADMAAQALARTDGRVRGPSDAERD
ncbi:site-specific integrase [Halostella sp. JP-L12]|uniref:site-specific integrase n=1 Tax=Halostella TaxID=1843185 RepID=UPI000EF80B2E|nr:MULTISPECIES: site-specific integrase [Halostella]NHN49445.1 site-specific integrase [Halostella sp. JP-L12]